MGDRNLGQINNLHGTERVSRSTPPCHCDMKGEPVKLSRDPTGAVGNGSKVKSVSAAARPSIEAKIDKRLGNQF